jgi:transposase
MEEGVVMIFVGDDWAEAHHDVWVMDEAGAELAFRRFREGIGGVGGFHDLVGEHVSDPSQVVIGIETDRGLWVHALVAAGYQVYAVNPKSVSRYRDRHRVSGSKSDRGDAKLLGDLVRTDRHNHRRVAGDSPQGEGIKVLARAHQGLIWERKRHTNRLRSALREYYPAVLATFDSLADRDTLAVLDKAPSPREGARLTIPQIKAALQRGGRQRNLDRRAAEIQVGLGGVHLEAPGAVTAAFAATTRSAVAAISEINRQIGQLEETLEDSFEQHPDAAIYLSMPGLGDVLGARVLGEFGDDPERFTDVKSRRNYAATSPLTIASGKTKTVIARYVRNNHLYDAAIRWAFCSLTTSPGCRAFYDQRRANQDTHYQALRALSNRLVGILHGCLKHRTLYNEDTAWAHRQPTTTTIAA